MSEHPNPAPANTLATVLDGQAPYLHPALHVLGLQPETFLPEAVQQKLGEIQPPPDIDWTGTPVWQTAYVTALRAIATVRHRHRADAPEESARIFNNRWKEKYLPSQEEQGLPATHVGTVALGEAVAPDRVKLNRAARQVRMANELLLHPPETLPSAPWSLTGEGQGERQGLQSYVGESLRWFSISPPRMSERTKLGKLPQFPDAFLVVSPTASGKTKMAADWLAGQGVGSPEWEGRSPRVLWVTDQQRLVKDCLRPDKTLRRCLPPEAKITAVWEGHKQEEDASGDVVVITKDSLVTELETGLIKPEDYDIVIFDEADVMLSDLKMTTIRRFDACRKLLMTATPARSTRRDLQRMVHHINPITLLEAVDRKIIAPVRILTFMARDAAHAERIATTAALHLFIKAGKKGAIYCQPGGGNAQAGRVAAAIKLHAPEVLGDNYDPDAYYAEMVGSVRPGSADIIDYFEDKVDAGMLTTSNMGGRGWDPKRFDGGIFIGEQGDPVAFKQEMGRGFRIEPDNPDKIAYIIQIKYPKPGSRANDYLAEMAFGINHVTTGITLGIDLGRKLESPESDVPGLGNEPKQKRDAGLERLLAGLPQELLEALQPLGRPLAEVLIAPDDPRYGQYVPPPGYSTSLTSLTKRYPGLAPQWFRNQLDHFKRAQPGPQDPAIGVPHVTVRNIAPDQLSREQYYLTEGVEEFLRKVDIPKVVAATSVNPQTLADQLGVPVTLVELGARTLNIDLTKKAIVPGAGVKPGARLDPEERGKITRWVQAIPVADGTKVWNAELTRRYGQHFVATFFGNRGIEVQPMLHPPDSDQNGIGMYVDVEDVAALKAEHLRIVELMLTHRSLPEIVRRTGMASRTIINSLTDEERRYLEDPNLRFTHIGGARKPARHLPNEVADRVETRLLNSQLKPHEVTRAAVAQWLGISQGRVAQLARDQKLPARRLGLRNLPIAIYHVSALAVLADYYRQGNRRGDAEQLLERLSQIDYAQLPARDAEPTPEQEAYCRQVQQLMGIAERPQPATPPSDTPAAEQGTKPADDTLTASERWMPYEQVLTELSCTPAELANFITMTSALGEGVRRLDNGASEIRADYVSKMQAIALDNKADAAQARTISLDKVAEQVGRSVGAVMNVVKQLGLETEVHHGQIPQEMGAEILRFLTGGKKADRPTQPTDATPVTAATEASPAAGAVVSVILAPGRERDEDGVIWRNIEGEHGILAELNCTPTAFAFLLDEDKKKGPRTRQNESGIQQISMPLLERIQRAIKRLKSFDTSGWMTHEKVAENMQLSPDELTLYMHEKGIFFGGGDLAVRRNVMRHGRLELLYSKTAWGKVLITQPKNKK